MVDAQQFNKGLETFGIRLFTELAKTNRQKNIIFSPFSIQTCIAMTRMGAEGQTAVEMDQVSAASTQDVEALAKNYHTILKQYEKSSILKIANKIYIMQGYEVREKFNDLLTKHFFSSVDPINFTNNEKAAETINTWVEEKTNDLIKNLIAPQMLNAYTRLVLVNAIHFKGEWVTEFPESGTREMDFYLDETQTVKVQMMHTKDSFKYGEFRHLEATALQMPYKDSDLSMLIILPNSRTGLVKLEEKLKNTTLTDLTQQMYSTKVIVDMPKFKAEFAAELSEPLKNLGMRRMFSSDAEFGNMLNSKEPLQVSAVVHKAFIEVNEKGTEAAAATAMCMTPLSVPVYQHFNANKPFCYTLLNTNGIAIFKGSVQYF